MRMFVACVAVLIFGCGRVESNDSDSSIGARGAGDELLSLDQSLRAKSFGPNKRCPVANPVWTRDADGLTGSRDGLRDVQITRNSEYGFERIMPYLASFDSGESPTWSYTPQPFENPKLDRGYFFSLSRIDDVVLVRSYELEARDARDGSLLWRGADATALQKKFRSVIWGFNLVRVSPGSFVDIELDGRESIVARFAARTGRLQSLHHMDGEISWAIADEEGTLFALRRPHLRTGDHLRPEVIAFTPDGTVKWSLAMEDGSNHPLATYAGRVFLSNGSVVSASDGRLLYTLAANVWRYVVTDTSAYATILDVGDRRVIRFDPGTGAVLNTWPYPVGRGSSNLIATADDSALLFTTRDGRGQPKTNMPISLELHSDGTMSVCDNPLGVPEAFGLDFNRGMLINDLLVISEGGWAAPLHTRAFELGNIRGAQHGWLTPDGSFANDHQPQ